MKHLSNRLCLAFFLLVACNDDGAPTGAPGPGPDPDPEESTGTTTDAEHDQGEAPESSEPPEREPPFIVDRLTVEPARFLPDLVVVSAIDPEGEAIAELTLTYLDGGEVLQGVADFASGAWRAKRQSLYTNAIEHEPQGQPIADGIYVQRLEQIKAKLPPGAMAAPCVGRFIDWLAVLEGDEVLEGDDVHEVACECAEWTALARGEEVGLCEY